MSPALIRACWTLAAVGAACGVVVAARRMDAMRTEMREEIAEIWVDQLRQSRNATRP
jgi:hypothetical protein